MEQVFFINPVAGKRDASAELVPQIQAAARQLQLPQPQIVVTQYAGQAREAAHRYAASGTPVALYACGGDGTLNELVQGAAGSANVAVGCVPCGSGNDYVRNFGAAGQAPFLDFAAQLQAQPCRVDLL
ncbi:MAG TPA: acylglycerol kinase family protein, partial [Gemmiger qucibialis]|nr:acylglycerol kinase family protein [Gemmiger qucibialis]